MSLNPFLSAEYQSPVGNDLHVGQHSGRVKHLEQNHGSETISDSSGYESRNINSGQTGQDSNQANGSTFITGEHRQKADGKVSQEVPFDQPIEDDKFDYDESEFNDAIKSEMDNLEILLKDIYSGAVPKDVLSDQEMNEENLKKFFEKYPQSKTDVLSVTLAGFYFALDDLESAKKNLARIRNPDFTEDDIQNAGYHRAYYIIKANLHIEQKNFKKAREALMLCWDIPQRFFTDGKENYLDFYATSMGRIYLKEGNLKEAEKCFKDALALRILYKNSRLISSSYNDLALLESEKRSEQSLQYLEKALEYDMRFKEEVKSNKYNVLSGQPDFKRPKLPQTEPKS